MQNKQTSLVVKLSEKLIEMIADSESLAGNPLQTKIDIHSNNQCENLMKDISNETVIEFLKAPETHVCFVDDKMFAYNSISNETIEIKNIGDHFLIMDKVLKLAKAKKRELLFHPNAEILNKDFILYINRNLLKTRYESGEVGIGNFRTVDFLGRPCNPVIGPMENGIVKPIKEWQPEKGGFIDKENKIGRVETLLDELLSWVNSKEFKRTPVITRTAMFYTRFMHIHPFRDGNSRTDRMLLNYLLIISGQKPSNVADVDYDIFLNALTQAITKKNYLPFEKIIKENQIKKASDLYISIIEANSTMGKSSNLIGDQINI